MALLYQEIMNVPGLTGTWQQRNAQYYKALGSPMGAYKGNLQQNLYLLDQIKKQNFPQAPAPAPQPAPQPVAPQQPLSQQYTQQGVQQVQNAADIPQFEKAVGTFADLWKSRFEPGVTTAGQSQIRPEFLRDYNEADYNYRMGMTNTGGERFGRALGGIGDLKAASNRAYTATLGDWVDQQKGALLEGWYNQAKDSWNLGRTQASLNQQDPMYKIPTWQEGLDKYGSAYGAGVTPSLFG